MSTRYDIINHLFALTMRHGITSEQLQNSLYTFPTFPADARDGAAGAARVILRF